MRRLLMIFATFALVTRLHTVHGASSKEAGAMLRAVRVELRDGSSKLVQLDGVGCNESICSRVAVTSRTVGNVMVNRTLFADIKAVRDISGSTAVFVFKDGTTRRVSIIPDNRVLYVIEGGHRHKIGLDDVRSVDFSVAVQ